MKEVKERAFDYIPLMARSEKPRDRGITQVRDIKGRGMAEMEDICQTAGEYIDVYKMACATQTLLPKEVVKKKIDLCHRYGIEVSTGGFLERVLLYGPDIVKRFLQDSKKMGFDIVEISTGLVYMPLEDKMNLIQYTRDLGLKTHPEISASYGIHEEEEVQVSTDLLIQEIEQALRAGAWKVLVEKEGLTENVKEKRFDVLGKIASAFDIRKLVLRPVNPRSLTGISISWVQRSICTLTRNGSCILKLYGGGPGAKATPGEGRLPFPLKRSGQPSGHCEPEWLGRESGKKRCS